MIRVAAGSFDTWETVGMPSVNQTAAPIEKVFGPLRTAVLILEGDGERVCLVAPNLMAYSQGLDRLFQKVLGDAARVDPSEIDLVLVGTFTPDFSCPSTACLVQDKLGLDAPAVDLQAACSGFIYALVTGAQYVATGNSKLALVIGGDCNSRIVDPQDRRIAPLFGDGAGAVLLSQGEPHQGLICYQMGADGSGGSLLQCASGGTRQPVTVDDIEAGRHFLSMDGRTVFKWAVRVLTDTIELVLSKSGMSIHDVSLFLVHQANQRIIDAAVSQLGIDPDRVFNNLQHYGNTSGGSIPPALDEAFQDGRINRGDTILMCGFGAGLTWGTSLFRW